MCIETMESYVSGLEISYNFFLKRMGLHYYDNRDMIRTIFPTIIQFVAFNKDFLEI